jgi:peptide/nickel transport system substrate-binding protein
MLKRARLAPALLALGATALIVAGCGSSGGKQGGSITLVGGTPPDSPDPGFGYTTQALEPDQVVYTPLVTYAHTSGTGGTQLIPGLAKSLPTISPDGKTYTLQLRPGLKYSNGTPVKASDFTFAVERSIKLPWGGKSFYTQNIAGAADYDSGKAKSISGITTDDSTGTITIKLTTPFGPFTNVLAYPSSAPIPPSTPIKNEPTNPPPGDGPYMFTSVSPNVGYTLKKNPNWASQKVPGIPAGHVDTINMKVNSNPNAEAQSVQTNSADVFDPGDTIPPSLVTQLKSAAADRFTSQTTPSTFYFFMNVKTKPFNNPLVRQAVNYAVDKNALSKLDSGFMKPECYFIPPEIVGHPSAPCPYYGGGDPTGSPNVAKAQALIKQSGLAGTPVTVWGQNTSPRDKFVLYYASVLNQIGLKATPKLIARPTYFQTIGNAKTPNVQTGFADWLEDFPHPTDYYLLLQCAAIQPVNNENYSQICDPHIESQLKTLNPVPQVKLQSVKSQWEALDEYTAKQAYENVWGEELLPKFTSNRVNFSSYYLHPVYLADFLSLELK